MIVEKLGVDKKSGRIAFLLKNSNPSIANALRRTMLELTPVMAIDEVEFKKNSSILYDEFIAHRLAMIPLKTDLKSYTVRSKCKCNGAGCARCTVVLSLKAKGPCIVKSSDIKSKDPAIKPAIDNIPIVKLLKNQELEFEAAAVLGVGSEHIKWSPCLAWYRTFPVIEIDDKKIISAEKSAQQSPVDIFVVKGGKLVVDKDKLLVALVANASIEAVEQNGIAVKGDSSVIVFHIESWGQLSPKEIFNTAIEALNDELKQIVEKCA